MRASIAKGLRESVRRLVALRRVQPEVPRASFNLICGNAAFLDSHQPMLARGGSRLNQPVNTGHPDARVRLAREFAGIESQAVAMTSVGRLKSQIRLKTQDGTRGARIAFLWQGNKSAGGSKGLGGNGGQEK